MSYGLKAAILDFALPVQSYKITIYLIEQFDTENILFLSCLETEI